METQNRRTQAENFLHNLRLDYKAVPAEWRQLSSKPKFSEDSMGHNFPTKESLH